MTHFNPLNLNFTIKAARLEYYKRAFSSEGTKINGLFFPTNFLIPVADASAYKQFGNSVAVPAIQATAEQVLNAVKIKILK